MNNTIKKLKTIFYLELVTALLIVVLYESDVLPAGCFTQHSTSEFVLLTVMELLTVILIPLALRLFKFKKIAADLSERKQAALVRWGTIRIEMLAMPLLANTLLYYLYMSTTFGYMAIILLICMVFIYPSKDKCYFETRDQEE